MTSKIYLIACLALVFLFVACAEPEPTVTPTPTPSIADIVKRTTPAVVQIVTPKSSGTGFFVRSDGVILTAGHLVEDVRTVDVIASDGRKWEGQVICRTPRRDLALVYVDDVNIPAVVLGDVEGLAPGDSVIKMGYAAGLPGSASVSSGIVSSIRGDADTATVLVQTDAPLNPGDSGGPLLDRDGYVVAISSKKWASEGFEGLGFAVSINEAKSSLLGYLKEGRYCKIPSEVSVFEITTDAAPSWLTIGGDVVVWREHEAEAVIGHDLRTGEDIVIARGMRRVHETPRIDGNIVVWAGSRTCTEEEARSSNCFQSMDVFGYDLGSHTEFLISTAPGAQIRPRISDDTIIWEDYRNGNSDIYGYDLTTREEFPVLTIGRQKGISYFKDDIVIWYGEQGRGGALNVKTRSDVSIPGGVPVDGTPLDARVSLRIGTTDLWGTYTPVIVEYDRVSDTRRTVFTLPRNADRYNVNVSGNIMVWADRRNGSWDIYGYDLVEDVEFVITSQPWDESQPVVDRNVVVWLDRRGAQNASIRGTYLWGSGRGSDR